MVSVAGDLRKDIESRMVSSRYEQKQGANSGTDDLVFVACISDNKPGANPSINEPSKACQSPDPVQHKFSNPESDDLYANYIRRYFTRTQQYDIDYPLVAFNKSDTSTLYVSYPQRQPSSNPTTLSIYTLGQIIVASGVLHNDSIAPTFAVLTLSRNHLVRRLWMQVFTFNDVADQAEWSNPENWTRTWHELHHSGYHVVAPLSEAKNISYQFVERDGVFSVAVKTQKAVSWISQSGTETVSANGAQLAEIDLLRDGNTLLYATYMQDEHLDKFLLVHSFTIDDVKATQIEKKIELEQALTWSIDKEVVTIVDIKLMSHNFRLGDHGLNKSNCLEQIDSIARDRHELRIQSLQVAQNIVAYKSKLYFLDSGREVLELVHTYPDRQIDEKLGLLALHSNFVLQLNGDYLTLKANPGSRELCLGSDRLLHCL